MVHSNFRKVLDFKMNDRIIVALLGLVLLVLSPFVFADPLLWKKHRLELITYIPALLVMFYMGITFFLPFYRLAKSRYGVDRRKVWSEAIHYTFFGGSTPQTMLGEYLREMREAENPDHEAIERVEPAEWRYRRESVSLKHQLEDMGFTPERPVHTQVIELMKSQGVKAAKRLVAGLGEYAVLLARLKSIPWSNELDYDKDVWPLVDRFDLNGLRRLVEDTEVEAALRIGNARLGFDGELEIPLGKGDGELGDRLLPRKNIVNERYLELYPLIKRYDSLPKRLSGPLEGLYAEVYRCTSPDVDDADFRKAHAALKKALDRFDS